MRIADSLRAMMAEGAQERRKAEFVDWLRDKAKQHRQNESHEMARQCDELADEYARNGDDQE